jgi:hypothetical protein
VEDRLRPFVIRIGFASWCIVENNEDFPAVAVRVQDPDLVLDSVTTVDRLLNLRRQPSRLKPSPHVVDSRDRFYLNTEVRSGVGRAFRFTGLDDREVQRWLLHLEAGIAGASLRRLSLEERLIELC